MSLSMLFNASLFLAFLHFATCAPIEIHFANRDGAAPYFERECGATLENMWLDIVFVVDNSRGMTTNGLTDVAADMIAVMGGGITIGVDPNRQKTSRVGIVTYNQDATVVRVSITS